MVFTQRPFGHTLVFCSNLVHLVQFSLIRHFSVPLGTGVVKTFRCTTLVIPMANSIPDDIASKVAADFDAESATAVLKSLGELADSSDSFTPRVLRCIVYAAQCASPHL